MGFLDLCCDNTRNPCNVDASADVTTPRPVNVPLDHPSDQIDVFNYVYSNSKLERFLFLLFSNFF